MSRENAELNGIYAKKNIKITKMSQTEIGKVFVFFARLRKIQLKLTKLRAIIKFGYET